MLSRRRIKGVGLVGILRLVLSMIRGSRGFGWHGEVEGEVGGLSGSKGTILWAPCPQVVVLSCDAWEVLWLYVKTAIQASAANTVEMVRHW